MTEFIKQDTEQICGECYDEIGYYDVTKEIFQWLTDHNYVIYKNIEPDNFDKLISESRRYYTYQFHSFGTPQITLSNDFIQEMKEGWRRESIEVLKERIEYFKYLNRNSGV